MADAFTNGAKQIDDFLQLRLVKIDKMKETIIKDIRRKKQWAINITQTFKHIIMLTKFYLFYQ